MTIKRTSSFYSTVRNDKQFLWTLGLTYPAVHNLAEATSKNLSSALKRVSTISLS